MWFAAWRALPATCPAAPASPPRRRFQSTDARKRQRPRRARARCPALKTATSTPKAARPPWCPPTPAAPCCRCRFSARARPIGKSAPPARTAPAWPARTAPTRAASTPRPAASAAWAAPAARTKAAPAPRAQSPPTGRLRARPARHRRRAARSPRRARRGAAAPACWPRLRWRHMSRARFRSPDSPPPAARLALFSAPAPRAPRNWRRSCRPRPSPDCEGKCFRRSCP